MTIDLCAAASMPHFGMYRVGKIKRRGAGGQIDNASFRGQYEHAVMKHFGMKAVQQLFIFRLFRIQQFTQ